MQYGKSQKDPKSTGTSEATRDSAGGAECQATSLRKVFDHLLIRLNEEVISYYGPRLTSLAVFGSVGRRTPTPDSDIDILIIAKDLPSGRMARVREFELIEKNLDNALAKASSCGINTRLSPLFRTEEEMDLGGLIFLDMIDDARILVDRDSFFQNYLDRLKSTLAQNKAVRVRTGSTWHWVLKPDLKPGEEIKL